MNALSPISLPLDVLRTPNLQDGVREQKALQEMEGLFLHLLMKEMRKSVPQGGLLGESPAQKMFQEMLDEVYAQKMAESGQLGIAKVMADQIALHDRQREIREALREAKTDLVSVQRRARPPDFFGLPQMGSGGEFMPLKSTRGVADMFSVDGLGSNEE